jgi:hypothetical protein
LEVNSILKEKSIGQFKTGSMNSTICSTKPHNPMPSCQESSVDMSNKSHKNFAVPPTVSPWGLNDKGSKFSHEQDHSLSRLPLLLEQLSKHLDIIKKKKMCMHNISQNYLIFVKINLQTIHKFKHLPPMFK